MTQPATDLVLAQGSVVVWVQFQAGELVHGVGVAKEKKGREKRKEGKRGEKKETL